MNWHLKSWLRRLTNKAIGKKPSSHRPRTSRPSSKWRRELETLECRVNPVVGYGYTPDVVSYGHFGDGVALVERSDGYMGSAVLLADRIHVLTAAHMVDNHDPVHGNGVADGVEWTLSFDTEGGLVTYTGLTAANVILPTGWTGDYFHNDIAIFKLPEAAPDIVPGYDIYRDQFEINSTFLIEGYGIAGENGATLPSGVERFGYNTVDKIDGDDANVNLSGAINSNLPVGTYLAYTLDQEGEAIGASGDSGGPLFIDGKIAGITSYGLKDTSYLVDSEAHAVRVSMYAKWIDGIMGINRDLVIDTRTMPGVGNNGRADAIDVQTNAYGDTLIISVNNSTIWSGSLRTVDSITLFGSGDVDTFTVGAGVGRQVNVSGMGNTDTLTVAGFMLAYGRGDYSLDGSTITANNSGGTTTIDFNGISSVNLYTQAGTLGGDPSIVTVNSRAANLVSVYTGSGDFAVNVNAIPSGGVNVVTGTGHADITVYSSGLSIDYGQVRISGTGRNTLTIDHTQNPWLQNVVVNASSVSVTTDIGAAGRIFTIQTITFDKNFLTALTVKGGTPYGYSGSPTSRGNTFTVRDTPSSVFGGTTVTLLTGGGNDDVRIEAISSPLTINGQGGFDTVTVGKNSSMSGIRYSLGVTNESGSTKLNLQAVADNWSHTVEVNTSGWGPYITGLSTGPILFGYIGVNVSIATGASDDTINVRYAPASMQISTGAGRDLVNVDAVAPDTILDIDGGTGRNTVHVGAAGYLNSILGTVQSRATGGSNILYIDDRNAHSPMSTSLTSSEFVREGLAPIRFFNADTLIIWSGSGGNQFEVLDTPANAYTTLNTGDGYDAVHVAGSTGYLYLNFNQGSVESLTIGGPVVGLDAIQGVVRIVSDGQGMSVTVDDTGTAVGQHVVIDHDALHRSGAAEINFGFAEEFPLFYLGGSGDDTIEVQGKRGNLGLLTGEGDDRIFIGTAAATLAELGHFVIDGQGGYDVVTLEDRGAPAGQPYEFFNPEGYADIPIVTTEGTTVVFATFGDDGVVRESATEALVLLTNTEAGAIDTNWSTQNLHLFINSEPTRLLAQTITFDAIADGTYGVGPITLNATASSGLAISYRIVSGPATLVDNELTITGAGVVTVEASQAGDDQAYDAAASVERTFTVNKARLLVAASSQTRVYGQSLGYTATITGFVNGESLADSGVTGAASLSSTATLSSPVGTYAITAARGTLDSANYDFSAFASGSLKIVKASVTLALQSSAASAAPGQAITFTATAAAASPGSGLVAGTVTFKDGATVLGTATLTNGVAKFTTTTLALGSHAITAVYAGNTNFTTKTSAVLTQAIVQTSKTTLTKSLASSVVGQSLTLTATVAPGSGTGTPTGTVTFKDGATVLGTATLSGGKATLTTTALRVGSHALTVVYSGSTAFGASTSASLTQTVNQAASTAALTSSATSATLGQTITLTARIGVLAPGAATPTGTVTFMDGATVIGTGTISNGVVTFKTTKLIKGKHTLTVVYGGDVNLKSSTSSALIVTIV